MRVHELAKEIDTALGTDVGSADVLAYLQGKGVDITSPNANIPDEMHEEIKTHFLGGDTAKIEENVTDPTGKDSLQVADGTDTESKETETEKEKEVKLMPKQYKLVGKGSLGVGGKVVRKGGVVSAVVWKKFPERVQKYFEVV